MRTFMNNTRFMQGHAVQGERAHHGYIFGHQLCGECVFFANLRLSPTLWSVELCNHRAVVIQMHLVDAVFIRTECAHASIYRQAQCT